MPGDVVPPATTREKKKQQKKEKRRSRGNMMGTTRYLAESQGPGDEVIPLDVLIRSGDPESDTTAAYSCSC